MCTRILWGDERKAKVPVVGRVMDWVHPGYRPDLWILPRVGERESETEWNPMKWPIKYGSLVVPVTWNASRSGKRVEVGAVTDGINEKGLAGHTLWLAMTKYPTVDDTRPTLNVAKWLQYYLDQFESVEEAVKDAEAKPFHLVPVKVGRAEAKLHLTLEDSNGDSAVIEYVDGEQHIHRGRGYSVITNSLTCDLQSEVEARKYKVLGGDQRLPGSSSSEHRFIRSWYYLEQLPEAQSERETVAYLLSVLRNVSYPFKKFDPNSSQNESTRWRSVINLTTGDNVYYFESTTNPNLLWVELPKIDFGKLQKLDLRTNPKRDLSGEVSGEFVAAPQAFEWAAPTDDVLERSPESARSRAGANDPLIIAEDEILLIYGGGPKAAAVCAKCRILKDLGLRAPYPIVFERNELGAAWTGQYGYTTGRQPLGTTPEKDVGFPYFKDSQSPEVTSEMFRHFSWAAYLTAEKNYGDWLDRGRPSPLHGDWAKYIAWVITKATSDNHGKVVIGEVSEIRPSQTGWDITVRGNPNPFHGHSLLITGTGAAQGPGFAVPAHADIMYGDDFWTADNLKRIEQLRVTEQIEDRSIVIVGGGETASSIAAYIAEQLESRRVRIKILTRGGAIFSRGEGYYENRVFTYHEEWKTLKEGSRLEIIRRADRGVFSPSALARLAQAPYVYHKTFDVRRLEQSPRGVLQVVNERDVRINCGLLIFAMGFDPLSFANMIEDQNLQDRLRRKIRGTNRYKIERNILDDLSVPDRLSPSKLYLPMLAGLSQGPGFPNLSCLGLLSDRILRRKTRPPISYND
jgi:mycobactin lysine-N-oxygenase